jgi:uncharacterized protein YacL
MKQQLKRFFVNNKRICVSVAVMAYVAMMVGSVYLLYSIMDTGLSSFTQYFEIYDSRFNLFYWVSAGLGFVIPMTVAIFTKQPWFNAKIAYYVAAVSSVAVSVVCYPGLFVYAVPEASLVGTLAVMALTVMITMWAVKKTWVLVIK